MICSSLKNNIVQKPILIVDSLIIYAMLAAKGNCKNQPNKDYKLVIVHEFGHSKIDTHLAKLDSFIRKNKIDTLYYPVMAN